jgi:hypothetical protein
MMCKNRSKRAYQRWDRKKVTSARKPGHEEEGVLGDWCFPFCMVMKEQDLVQ